MARWQDVRLPNEYRLNTLSRLYVDGVPLEDLEALYQANTRYLGGQRWNAPNRFWAAPPRDGDSRIREVMEVSLGSPKWLNKFSFQMSMFPCRAFIQWWDAKDRVWREVRDRKTGRPWQQSVNHSVPSRIPEDVVNHHHRHPHHFGKGHWRTITANVKPIKANRVRLILVRIEAGEVPRNRQGKKVPYSVAVQEFQLGFEVKHPKDAPRRKVRTQDVELAETFTSSNDLLGSPVSFGLREYKANDILWPSRQALAGTRKADREHDTVVWKCEPQPFSFGVVNLYADARDSEGEPQTVDRFWLDPLTPGVHCNLYYSNDTLGGDFEASEDELRYPLVQAHGEVKAKRSGLEFSTNTGYLDVDNQGVQWRHMRPWWAGMVFRPQFTSEDSGEFVILDSRGLQVRWRDQNLEVVANGVTLIHDNISFGYNEPVRLVVGWTGTEVQAFAHDRWSAVSPTIGEVDDGDLDPVVARQIRFGANRDDSESVIELGNGNFRLDGFVLKHEAPINLALKAEQFSSDHEPWMLKPEIDDDGDDLTRNALLRYHPFLQTTGTRSLNPYGWVGGPGLAYENLAWTPINRDYRLVRGYMQFDPVQAKYFKFEFTNLTPEPYQSSTVQTRKVKLFTVETALRSRPTNPGTSGRRLADSGAIVNETLGDLAHYSDMMNLVVRDRQPYEEYTPTEALYSRDPVARQRLAKISALYDFHPWHKSSWAPRFTQTQRHYYETVEIEHRNKVAFFVGLRGLRMYRVDYTADDDSGAYDFTFSDDTGLEPETTDFSWLRAEGGLLSGEELPGGYVVTTSQVLNSRRNVRGLQFASIQTPARQLLSDPDFNDLSLQRWQPYGGAQVEASEDLNSDIGTTVKITRTVTGAFWNYLETKYPTWDSIEDSDADPRRPTWDALSESQNARPVGGVESIEMIQPSRRGRLYAAARVYSTDVLNAPLHVQIVAQTGEVLSDQQINASGGRVNEWFTSYTIGEGGDTVPRTWDEVTADFGTWNGIEGSNSDPLNPTWSEVSNFEEALSGPVFLRLYQDGATEDEFYVDNISLYEDPIVWEFSNDDGDTWWPVYDIRNHATGAFLFPDVTPETSEMREGTNLRWRVYGYRPGLRIDRLRIRPWYKTLPLGVPHR